MTFGGEDLNPASNASFQCFFPDDLFVATTLETIIISAFLRRKWRCDKTLTLSTIWPRPLSLPSISFHAYLCPPHLCFVFWKILRYSGTELSILLSPCPCVIRFTFLRRFCFCLLLWDALLFTFYLRKVGNTLKWSPHIPVKFWLKMSFG